MGEIIGHHKVDVNWTLADKKANKVIYKEKDLPIRKLRALRNLVAWREDCFRRASTTGVTKEELTKLYKKIDKLMTIHARVERLELSIEDYEPFDFMSEINSIDKTMVANLKNTVTKEAKRLIQKITYVWFPYLSPQGTKFYNKDDCYGFWSE